MSKDIKTRSSVKDIKKIDKAVIVHDKIKSISTKTKNSIEENKTSNDHNATDYATNRVSNKSQRLTNRTAIETRIRVKQGARYIKDKRTKRKQTEDIINETDVSNTKIKTRQVDSKNIKTLSSNKTIKGRTISIKINSNNIKSISSQQIAKQASIKQVNERMTHRRILSQKRVRAAKKAAVATKNAVKRILMAAKSTMTLLCSIGSIGLIVIILIALIGGIFMSGSSSSGDGNQLSQEVIEYTPVIQKYANEYEIPKFLNILQSIMMAESGGKGNDPMQSSECSYNKKYPRKQNGITDPNYSIEVGVHNFADCLKQSKCNDPLDIEKISLALQGYNFGNGYIEWAIKNFGGYSQGNAQVFSDEQTKKNGTSSFGDPEYVSKVLKYYQFTGTGKSNSKLVNIAITQLGNKGGSPYWSWYGYKSRVEWCACFVSWVANQSGELNKSIPKFAAVKDGIQWYKDKGLFKPKGYTPNTGDIIFFDWQPDGISDHVGIVEKVEGNTIYTIEGNSNDECKRCEYTINSKYIYGFGIKK